MTGFMDLGMFEGGWGSVADQAGLGPGVASINSTNQVAATEIKANGGLDAYLLEPSGSVHDMGILAGYEESFATSINDAGQIVGYSATTNGTGITQANHKAFVYNPSTGVTPLGSLGGTDSVANAINGSGQIAGYSTTTAGQTHAFLYNGQWQDLGTLQGATGSSYGTGINKQGQVVGYSSTGRNFDAFLSDAQTQKLSDLGTLPGYINSFPMAVNDAGQVVGFAAGENNPNALDRGGEAFLHDTHGWQDLGSFGGSSYAMAINNIGQIVGYSGLPPLGGGIIPYHAFLVVNGQMTDLNTYAGIPSGWTLITATAINDNGWIGGIGSSPTGQADGYSFNPFSTRTPTPTIRWPAPAAIIYGTPLGPAQLDATTSVPGTFTYNPPIGTVLHAGTDQRLSVTFTPVDTADYTAATASVMINVARATPTIRWPSPAAISPWSPLGPAQLDATANVPGTFAYDPPAGTILGIGRGQRLSVIFTPSDTTDYTGATATVTIDVLSGPQGPGHHSPAGGHLHTVSRVTAHPRSAHVGASVILTATVKILGSASEIPTGSVEFLDGSAALNTISLSAGTASLVTSSLHPGRNAIRVHYLGTGDLPSSSSRAVVVTVKQRHSKAKHAGAVSRRLSTPLGFTSAGAEKVGPAAIAAPLLADSAVLGPVTSDQIRRSQPTWFSPGPYPAGILPGTVHVPGVDSPRRQVARQATPAASRGPTRLIDPE